MLKAQVSGVVNDYIVVEKIDFCQNTLTVTDAAGLSAGDRVLLAQMKGASINISNTSSFGQITSMNAAGNYEFNRIAEINGNQIVLEFVFENAYAEGAAVQLITVPEYQNVTISDTLKALPWDGEKGGIVVIEALGTVELNSVIDVSEKGFEGGKLFNSTHVCNWLFPQSDYFYTFSSQRAGRKGEGIVNFNPQFECGRGAYGNGGGGGNDHNTGGGGGANYGNGGAGGKRLVPSQFFCNGEYRGLGGNAIDYATEPNRLILGGGGGAGHVDDSLGTGGANGGGIVIIKAAEIVSNNGKILANGASAKQGTYDGVGGGGAGGSVFLFTSQIQNTLVIEANGGNGGNVSDNLSNTCYGPGGGGGGGFIGLSEQTLPTSLTASLTGGSAGINIQPSTECASGDNDPQDGEDGGIQTGLTFTNASIPFSPPVFEVISDTLICPGDTVSLLATGGDDYLWSPVSSLSCSNCPEPFAYPGVTTQYEVTIFAGACEHIDTVTIEVAQMPEISIQPGDIFLCKDTVVELTATGAPNFDYTWFGGDLPAPVQGASIQANPTETQTYQVEWTTADGACTVSDQATVSITSGNFGTFPSDKSICLGQSVQLIASGGTQFQWQPDTDLSCNDCPNPIASPAETTTYSVFLSNAFGCSDSATFTITVDEPVSFEPVDTLHLCDNASFQLDFTESGTYSWHPADFLSCTDCPDPVIVEPQYDVTYSLTLTQGACSYTDILPVQVLESPPYTLIFDTIEVEFNEPFEVVWDTTDIGYSFSWSPDIGIDDTSTSNPIITGVQSGYYSVTITDEMTGCTVVDSFYLKVLLSEEVEQLDLFPNAFLPTGGGANARFGPFHPGPGHDFVSFRIFNRWGQKMFSGGSFEDGWDGSFKGKIQPMDTYVYELVFIKPNGKRAYLRGSVILIR